MAPTPRLHRVSPSDRRARLSVGRARPKDLPALQELLSLCALPFDGVADHLHTFLLARDGVRLAGSVAIERHGTDGLLRSLAVHPEYRRRGLGARLTRRALGEARRLGLRRLFLLTETASEYFLRFQFRPVPRGQAPPALQSSVEFASACPETAICMENSALLEHPAQRPRASRPQQSSLGADTPGYVAVGRIGAPWGVHGDVKVRPLTDFPERFRPSASLWVRGRRYEVRRSRSSGGLVYLGLSDIDSREVAGELRGALLEVPEGDLTPLPEGQYYRFQIVGLEVYTPQGSSLGRVAEVLPTGSNDVYIVRGGPRELLIPAIEDVVREVDLERGRLIVEPPAEV